MAESDEIVYQAGLHLEILGGAARNALRGARGFSPEQEAAFAGDGQTLRARLLDQWQRLLGPLLSEETPVAHEKGAAPGPASMIKSIQNYEIGSGGADRDESVPLDHVRKMGIVRGTAYGSQRLAALRHRPREIVLQVQTAAFVRQYLSEEEEEEWSRTPPLKKLVRMLQALARNPPEVSRRDPGRVWKDFVACFPPETLRYQCEIGKDLFLGDPEALADLLLAVTQTMQEFAEPTQKAGQPLGYVLTFPARATEIKPYQAGDKVPILVYHQVGDRTLGELISIRPGDESAFRSEVERSLGHRGNWRDLDALDEALIAVNVTLPQQPGEGMFSQEPGFVNPGFDFHLKPASPCINRGTNNGAAPEDMDKDPIPMMGTADVGADEFTGEFLLTADAFSVSAATGGTINYTVFAGEAKAGRTYLMLGTLSGTVPGTVMPGGLVLLPLNMDVFTTAVVLPYLNTSLFINFLGTLDSTGAAFPVLNVPVLPPEMVGYTMHYAYTLGDPFDLVSNPVELRIVP